MKKSVLAILLAVCMLVSCCLPAFAENDGSTVCLHENAQWELSAPPTPVTQAYYTRTCPDCGFTQTAKKARTSFIEAAFDMLSRCFFLLDKPVLSDDFTVTAHTGPGEIKMNSMFSLRYSLQSGADVVEFDLATNSQGVAVMAHDNSEKNAPTLEEGFALVAKYVDTMVNVDVKDFSAVEQAQALAIKYGILDRIFYTGVTEGAFSYVRQHSPLVPCYLNGCSSSDDPAECAAFCDKAVAMGAIGLNFGYADYSDELAAAAHERGLLISLYTVNKTADLRTCLEYDADNITTEFPYRLYTMTNGRAEKC